MKKKTIVLLRDKCYNGVKKDCENVTKMLKRRVYISEENFWIIPEREKKERRAGMDRF